MGAPDERLRYSLVTARRPDRLTKAFRLGEDGSVIKEPAGNLVEGHVRHESAADLLDLSAQLDRMPRNTAPTWGLSVRSDAPILTLHACESRPDAIARGGDYFKFYAGPGVMMLDHDTAPPGSPGFTANALLANLYDTCPALVDACMLVRPSASAGIVDHEGGVLIPATRWRIYIPVSNATDIPGAGDRLLSRLWAAGMGWFAVSRSGIAYEQTILDGAVWQPERLDFVAAPDLHNGLRRVVPAPLFAGLSRSGLFDLSVITTDAHINTLATQRRAEARQAIEPEARRVRAAYIELEAPRLASKRGCTVDDARVSLNRAGDGELDWNFILTLRDGRAVTVDELLADRTAFHRVRMHDPLEPEYRDDNRIALAMLDGDGCIVSHARGGCRYRLRPSSARVFAPVLGVPAVPALPPTAPPQPIARGGYGVTAADPLGTARVLVAERFAHPDGSRLRSWQGSCYRWGASHWREMQDPDLRAELYDFLDQHGESHFRPKQSIVSNLADAVKHAAGVHLDSTHTPPCWIAGETVAAPADLVACANGLLHLPTRSMLPTTPRFFNLNAVPYDYDPHAPPPAQWLQFLASLWPNDPEAIATLQEIFGYLLTPDTSQQKIFLIVGPKRSGKGTIARVLTEMLGADNVTGPTLASMAGQFGLQSLIGSLAAIISDARLGGKTDSALVAENLLRVSGEDRIEVARKNLPALTLRLGTRFVLLTNELPRIADASGAMASRFVILTMTESFFGREDPGLTARLLSERPGILLWSAEGWHRLRTRGHFIEPKSSAGAAQELADLGSPISAFVRDQCELSPHAEVDTVALATAWREWCARQGMAHAGDNVTFGRNLKAACPQVQKVQRRDGPDRGRIYRGIRLSPHGTRGNPFLASPMQSPHP